MDMDDPDFDDPGFDDLAFEPVRRLTTDAAGIMAVIGFI
jgi:hypothetical protein